MDSNDIDDILSEDNVESEVSVAKAGAANDTSDKSRKPIRNALDVFIAEGVYTDCENILKEFLLLQTSTFEDFARIWKEKKFIDIYAGKDTFSELLEFSEEVLAIAKSFILPPHSQIKRIGALYLMYGLYTQQPLHGAIKYRVTPQEWGVILKFVENLKAHGFIDANYIFHKLSYDGAFLTVSNAREYGLERNFRKYLMPWPARDQEHLPDATYSLETLMGRVYRGSLKADAEKCRSKYNRIKVLLEATQGSKFQHVHGADAELDKVIQENLEGSLNSADSLGGSQMLDSVGRRRTQLKDRAFAMPAQQSAHSSHRKETEMDNASTSECDPQNTSEPSLMDPEESESESGDSDFQYIVKPPSKRNSRKLKQRKNELSRKKSKGPPAKKSLERKTRKSIFEEVTGIKPTPEALHSKVVPKGKPGRKKGSKNNPVPVDTEDMSLDESHLIVDVPVKRVRKSRQVNKSLDIPVDEVASSSSTVRRSSRTPKKKKAFSPPDSK